VWIDANGSPQTRDFTPDEALNSRLRTIARDLHKLGPCNPGDDPHDDLADWVHEQLPEWIAASPNDRRLVGAAPPPAVFDPLLRLRRKVGYAQMFAAVDPEWRLDLARLLDRYVY
jgi:hypothetical protein